ncbi:histone deacetylase [Thiomicrorhabdus immobilis]|uniref:Histone deacetylase n=1 Tax=Thiomicrorhabdus immobilis TaxID=2791037 RepID=A0ABN6CZH0_9GAMM|nr:histone deacetylase [Thiomicrorhabdus immobilis]BCN94453.1 histone deacetylase [Thiomicrorhabdus immobilis]
MSNQHKLQLSRRLFIQQASALLTMGSSAPLLANQNSPNRTNPKVGVVLDQLFYKHNQVDHPENAKRLIAIDEALTQQDIWRQLTPVKGRLAFNEELLWAHSQGYIDQIEVMSDEEPGYFDEYQQDTYINKYTFDAARMAAGSAINLNLAVYDRLVDTGFALLRPPGHHALEDRAMGFCIFNSDVIAARALQQERGVKRVAIIDFDVHHGNGTQDLTANDPSIMAISIHQHPYWPLTGGLEFTGHDDAKGTIVNCPFQKGAGDNTYLGVYDEVIHKKLESFQPEHIIVFAGYDAHWQDPLAGHQMSVKGFNQLVERCVNSAQQICNGRISFSLGGGYNLKPLAECVAGTFHTLLNNPQKANNPLDSAPTAETDYSAQIEIIKQHHLS